MDMIYTSALPSHIASHAMMRILYPLRLTRQKTLEKNTIHLHKYLQKAGYDTNNSSHIIPVHIGDEKTALGFSKRLLKDGVYAQAVRYPTVEKNSARIRLSVTASMTLRQIHTISDAIESAGRFFKII